MQPALRALNGFGLGARHGEGRGLRDPREWLRAQLRGEAPLLPAPAAASPAAIAEGLRAFRAAAPPNAQPRQDMRRDARQKLVAIATAESHAAIAQRVTTERPFVERLVAFWSNHLCVSVAAKILVAPLAGSYEREAIRPHVLGRFADMVLASAKHPAMLVYLDNFQSVGPNSGGARFGPARGRQQRRGLNENYARELLELHTLGVNGGYSQQDVQELAKILTGWTVSGLGRPGAGQGRAGRNATMNDTGAVGFQFQELLHEPGSKSVLGRKYAEAGVDEGERVIRDLCRHPATATFVATKLVTHFVNDAPPAAAVDRVARVFRETDGDLRAVSAALVDLPDAWGDNARKFRSPQDWVIAMLRGFNAGEVADAVMPILRQLRHPLWSPPAPKGFDDTTQAWADPDSLLNRAELARTVARRLRLQRIDPRALLDVVDVAAGDPLHAFVPDTAIAAGERAALVLAGPQFQWR